MIFWVSSSWFLAPPQSLILTAHHLEHRKGETESKRKETIKKETRREQKHTESAGNGKGWSHLDRKQRSRRHCKNKTSILLYPLFHSFLKFIFFSLSLEHCTCFGNAWEILVGSEDCFHIWGGLTLQLPYMQVKGSNSAEGMSMFLNIKSGGSRLTHRTVMSPLPFGKDNTVGWKESWALLDSTLPLRSCVTLCKSLSLFGSQCPQLKDDTPNSKILSSFESAQYLIIYFVYFDVLKCFP